MPEMQRYRGIAGADPWPDLPLAAWKDTYDTLHMWTQIVGKVRLALAPMMNHWWQVPLYVTCYGLTTSSIPYGQRVFSIDFDFIDHRFSIHAGEGVSVGFPLTPCSVADFYREVMDRLRSLGIDVQIWSMPVEIPNPVPFEEDHRHASYDREYANRFWRILVQSDRLLTAFRANFVGKASPVQFFWGTFDLSLTLFSGRLAPRRPGPPNLIEDEAYTHEEASFGFWPGGNGIDGPAYYAYGYPEPPGYATAPLRPSTAFYSTALREFILPYEAVARSAAPDAALNDFLCSTYEAEANLARWDRASLERPHRASP